jgi:hypothetical protein
MPKMVKIVKKIRTTSKPSSVDVSWIDTISPHELDLFVKNILEAYSGWVFGISYPAGNLREVVARMSTKPIKVPERSKLFKEDIPWLKALSIQDQRELLKELLLSAKEAIDTGKMEIFSETLDAWRETGHILADKELLNNIKEAEKEAGAKETVPWKEVKKKLNL